MRARVAHVNTLSYVAPAMDALLLDTKAKTPPVSGLTAQVPARVALRAGRVNGVDHAGGGTLRFDERRHTPETAEMLRRHVEGESLAPTFAARGEAAEVTQEDLDIINERHSGQQLEASDIEVFQRYSANDKRMRRPLRFTSRALRKLAEEFTEGRTVLVNHDNDRWLGRTFAARVEEATVRGITANWLAVRFYVVTEGASEQRMQDIQDVRTGVMGYDSPTVAGGAWEFQEVEGPDGETDYFYEIDSDPDGDPLEAWELSMVYIGAGRGAGSNVVKNAPNEQNTPSPPPHNRDDVLLCATL